MMRLLPLALALSFIPAAPAENTWPQWRGPLRTGEVPGAAEWPASLAQLDRLWRVELDKGFPGPIVAEDRVFVAETANTDTELVRALDRKSGRELWRASWKGKISVPFYAKRSGDWIRATPAWDGEALYVAGMEEVLVALDGKTGKERWRVDFPQRFGTPKPEFGFASSPLVHGEFIFVQAANALVKLRKKTGETVWRTLENRENIFESGAFSSPFLARTNGRDVLLVQSRTTLHGVDPESGKEIWSQPVPNFRGMNILTPVAYRDGIFTSSYRNESYFYRVRPDQSVEEVWRNKTKGYMSTPVVIGDFVYLHLQSQRFTCLDLRTGETRWTSPQPFGQYWSFAVRGDKILALDERGQLLLVRANPDQFELLDSREVTESSAWAHLAVAGEEIFIRDLSGITAYRWKK
ncbi:MAG: PQQ-like beta-propeller repeat protein [Bryobacteraceae bacterium]|nr:PQQ-like beta-propeller repeat protein [Solibacteraceae bacterium]MCO5352520.1 PQQ-like beta-propeller repeat protein [Bryobacteraceae bacterium]